jgi:hypothetical protein
MIKKIVLITMVVFGFSVESVRASSTANLDEIRQISAEDQNIIKTAHIVYTHQRSYGPWRKEAMDIIGQGLSSANQHILTREEFFLDNIAKKAKKIMTDLRDINALIADYNIPDTRLNRLNLDQSAVFLYDENNLFYFNPDTPSGLLDKFSGRFEPDFATLGIIPLNLLNQDVQLDDIEENGSTLLKISRSEKVPTGSLETVVTCEPSKGFRLRSIRWSHSGKVSSEIIADDYREANGIPYPFSYTVRFLDGQTVRNENKYTIERAEFGTNLSDDDFKVFITQRTPISDISGMTLTLPRSALGKGTGIKDILAVRDEAEELYKAQHQQMQ